MIEARRVLVQTALFLQSDVVYPTMLHQPDQFLRMYRTLHKVRLQRDCKQQNKV